MQNRSMQIQDFEINDSSKCFVIAEIGHNHQGSVETAKKMIKAAVDAGASAVKLQKREQFWKYLRRTPRVSRVQS